VIARVAETAHKRDLPPARIALAWVLHKHGVTAPILGATRASHLDDAAAATAVELDADEIHFLEEAYVPRAAEHKEGWQ